MKTLLIYLAKALLKASLDAALKRAMPEIYKRLDGELPLLLANRVPPSVVKGVIASAVSDSIGKRANPAQVSAIAALYDPIAAAINNMNRPFK